MDIIGKRKWWFIISGLIILPGLLALILWGLKLGIDFSGGTLIELEFSKATKIKKERVEEVLAPLNLENLQIQITGENSVFIRTKPITKEEFNEIKNTLTESMGEAKELRFETVGPTVSKSLTQKAVIAVIVASIAIILYIAWAFRKVPAPASSFRFGVCAILALIHDLLVVCGIFAILGHFLSVEIDGLFITALLTVMGFSVNDTIVVFDRIRENLKLHPDLDFGQVANESVAQTITRSINTSLTTLLILICIYIFGGESLRYFVLALLIGIFIGTYSSIFTASPILVVWQNWIGRKKLKRA